MSSFLKTLLGGLASPLISGNKSPMFPLMFPMLSALGFGANGMDQQERRRRQQRGQGQPMGSPTYNYYYQQQPPAPQPPGAV